MEQHARRDRPAGEAAAPPRGRCTLVRFPPSLWIREPGRRTPQGLIAQRLVDRGARAAARVIRSDSQECSWWRPLETFRREAAGSEILRQRARAPAGCRFSLWPTKCRAAGQSLHRTSPRSDTAPAAAGDARAISARRRRRRCGVCRHRGRRPSSVGLRNVHIRIVIVVDSAHLGKRTASGGDSGWRGSAPGCGPRS